MHVTTYLLAQNVHGPCFTTTPYQAYFVFQSGTVEQTGQHNFTWKGNSDKRKSSMSKQMLPRVVGPNKIVQIYFMISFLASCRTFLKIED